MRRRNRLKALGMATLLSVGAAYSLASWDWCDWPAPSPPRLALNLHGDGPLLAGAGEAPLAPPYPVVPAGYAPPRPELSSSTLPLRARAVVLRQGALSFGLVSFDLVLIPADVANDIRARSGLNETWTVATHTHSSFGHYDARLISQLAGTGRFREAAKKAVVDAAVDALSKAVADASVASVEVASGEADLSVPRSGAESDTRITRVRFIREGKPDARWLLLAAHPTFVPRKPTALDPDYPGRLDGIVLQTAGGNARANAESLDAFVLKVNSAFAELKGEPVDASLSVARVTFSLPAPDASQLVPRLFTMPGKNFICASAAKEADVGVLKLGTLVLLGIPGEVPLDSAKVLEHDGVRVVSLVNGYLGYVEPPEVLAKHEGESIRQYYGPTYLETLKAASEVFKP